MFTPYKRRKRKDTSDGEGSGSTGVRKLKRLECREGQENSNGEDSCDSNGGNECQISLFISKDLKTNDTLKKNIRSVEHNIGAFNYRNSWC